MVQRQRADKTERKHERHDLPRERVDQLHIAVHDSGALRPHPDRLFQRSLRNQTGRRYRGWIGKTCKN